MTPERLANMTPLNRHKALASLAAERLTTTMTRAERQNLEWEAAQLDALEVRNEARAILDRLPADPNASAHRRALSGSA